MVVCLKVVEKGKGKKKKELKLEEGKENEI